MGLANSNFFKRRGYLFSAIFVTYIVLSSTAAFGQIDFFYGINKRGYRVSASTGVTKLNSNWGTNGLSYGGTFDVDYDFTQFFSIGLEGEYGSLYGEDTNNRLTPGKTKVIFGAGSLNMKLGLGQVVDFFPKNGVQDVLKRIYIGSGIGLVNSNVTLTPHTSPVLIVNNNNKYMLESMRNSIEVNHLPATGSGTFTVVPINFGTYISLRKYFKRDALEINPNVQYNVVLSPFFDGYQPASKENGTLEPNGDQAYVIVSVGVRYKFH